MGPSLRPRDPAAAVSVNKTVQRTGRAEAGQKVPTWQQATVWEFPSLSGQAARSKELHNLAAGIVLETP